MNTNDKFIINLIISKSNYSSLLEEPDLSDEMKKKITELIGICDIFIHREMMTTESEKRRGLRAKRIDEGVEIIRTKSLGDMSQWDSVEYTQEGRYLHYSSLGLQLLEDLSVISGRKEQMDYPITLALEIHDEFSQLVDDDYYTLAETQKHLKVIQENIRLL